MTIHILVNASKRINANASMYKNTYISSILDVVNINTFMFLCLNVFMILCNNRNAVIYKNRKR